MPSSRGFSDPGIKPSSSMPPALGGGFFATKPAGKPYIILFCTDKLLYKIRTKYELCTYIFNDY